MTPEISIQDAAHALEMGIEMVAIAGVLVGALSVRTWYFIRESHWRWRSHRRWAARRRRHAQALSKFIRESRS